MPYPDRLRRACDIRRYHDIVDNSVEQDLDNIDIFKDDNHSSVDESTALDGCISAEDALMNSICVNCGSNDG